MPPLALTALVGVIVLLGLTIWAGARRWSPRTVGSLGLLVALVGVC